MDFISLYLTPPFVNLDRRHLALLYFIFIAGTISNLITINTVKFDISEYMVGIVR